MIETESQKNIILSRLEEISDIEYLRLLTSEGVKSTLIEIGLYKEGMKEKEVTEVVSRVENLIDNQCMKNINVYPEIDEPSLNGKELDVSGNNLNSKYAGFFIRGVGTSKNSIVIEYGTEEGGRQETTLSRKEYKYLLKLASTIGVPAINVRDHNTIVSRLKSFLPDEFISSIPNLGHCMGGLDVGKLMKSPVGEKISSNPEDTLAFNEDGILIDIKGSLGRGGTKIYYGSINGRTIRLKPNGFNILRKMTSGIIRNYRYKLDEVPVVESFLNTVPEGFFENTNRVIKFKSQKNKGKYSLHDEFGIHVSTARIQGNN